mgnify:CR=1 FL=1
MQSLETLTERDFDSVWEIMEESFPRDERRSREAQRKILDVSWYHLYGYRAHGELMAFLAVWEFDTFLFVEHFAVRKSCRNGGLGAVLLTQLTTQSRKPVILEVELPTGELEARRIAFYERNGFYYNDYFYMQPPIAEGRNAIPLRLMTTGGPLDEEEFFRMQGLLYKNVYGVPEDWSWK